MPHWLVVATEQVVVAIEVMATLIIVVGTIEAFVGVLRALFSRETGFERRDVWIRFARALVAGLTFQLAADIVESSVRTSWESIGQLGAVAVIRTFLNYFLDRDIKETRERQKATLSDTGNRRSLEGSTKEAEPWPRTSRTS